jgi:integrase
VAVRGRPGVPTSPAWPSSRGGSGDGPAGTAPRAASLAAIGLPGLHFHDLRHTANTLAAQDGVSLADLKARMGHDSVRAAMIYQHAAAEADQKIANMLDRRMRDARDNAHDQG